MNQTIEQLESKIQALIAQLHTLNTENNRITDELKLARQDFEQQAQELNEERIKHNDIALLAANQNSGNEELSSKIEYQEQQIQLLEKERLNLRDQIAFLQNTIQNKEKDWQGKIEQCRNELGEQALKNQESHAEQQQRIETLQQTLHNAESQISSLRQQLNSQAQQIQEQTAQSENQINQLHDQINEQDKQIIELQQNLDQSQNNAREAQTKLQAALAEIDEQRQSHSLALQEQQAQAQDEFLREVERQKSAIQMLEEAHSDTVKKLNQQLEQEKQNWENEKNHLCKQISQLNAQNQAYRSLLQQSASELRTLLNRLPAQDETQPIQQNGETA